MTGDIFIGLLSEIKSHIVWFSGHINLQICFNLKKLLEMDQYEIESEVNIEGYIISVIRTELELCLIKDKKQVKCTVV